MFCTSCGKASESEDNFCGNCGKALRESRVRQPGRPSEALAEKQKKTYSEEAFSSNILLGGSVVTPDRLILESTGVTYRKRNSYLIGVDSVSLSYANISAVRIDRKLISCTIIISSRGAEEIRAENFSIGDGKRIKTLILERI
jgi:hypothetical protein